MKFLNHLRLQTKFILLLALPVLCAAYFSITGIITNLKTTEQMAQLNKLAELANTMTALVHESQKERALSSLYIGSKGASYSSELTAQRAETDKKAAEFKSFLSGFDKSKYGSDFGTQLEKASAALGQLAAKRELISGVKIPAKESAAYFSGMNINFIDVVGHISNLSDDQDVTRKLNGYTRFVRAKELSGQERAQLIGAFDANAFAPGAYSKYVSLVAVQENLLGAFLGFAAKDESDFYNQKMTDPAVKEVLRIRGIAIDKGMAGEFGIESKHWYDVSTKRINLMKDVEDKLATNLVTLASAKKAGADASLMLSVVMIALTGVSIVLAFVITNAILNPLKACVEFSNKVAQGDLTQHLKLDQRDELGDLGRALDQMVLGLQNLIGQIQANAASVASASEELSATSTQMQQTANEMTRLSETAAGETDELDGNIRTVAAAIQQSSSNVQQIASASERIERTMDTVESSANQMSGNLQTVAAAAEEMSTSVNTVAVAMEEMTSSLNEVSKNATQGAQVAKQVQTSAEQSIQMMDKLNHCAKEIGNVVDVIKSIASQTNLLALNATIEASSAGEAGKGFAVVANEVKELAKQSAEATEDIRVRIEEIQSSTSEAVQTINKIANVISDMNEINHAIASAVEQQTATANEISRNVGSAAQATSEVSKNVLQTAEYSSEVTNQVQDTLKAIKEIVHNIDELAKGSNEIARISTEAASRTTDLAKDVVVVKDSAGETAMGAVNLKQSANDLAQLSGKLEELISQFRVAS